MKQTTIFTMTNGDKHKLVLNDPSNPDFLKRTDFTDTTRFTITNPTGTYVLNPQYVVSIEIIEKD